LIAQPYQTLLISDAIQRCYMMNITQSSTTFPEEQPSTYLPIHCFVSIHHENIPYDDCWKAEESKHDIVHVESW